MYWLNIESLINPILGPYTMIQQWLTWKELLNWCSKTEYDVITSMTVGYKVLQCQSKVDIVVLLRCSVPGLLAFWKD